jgi:hypothetical protein
MIACDRHNNMHYCLFVLCVLILLAPFTPRVFANPHRCRRPTTVNQIVAPVTVATVVPGYQATAFRQRTVTRQRIIATQPNAVLAAALVAPQPVHQRQLVQQQLLVQPASEALRYRQQTQLLPQNTAYLMGVADTQLTQPQYVQPASETLRYGVQEQLVQPQYVQPQSQLLQQQLVPQTASYQYETAGTQYASGAVLGATAGTCQLQQGILPAVGNAQSGALPLGCGATLLPATALPAAAAYGGHGSFRQRTVTRFRQ